VLLGPDGTAIPNPAFGASTEVLIESMDLTNMRQNGVRSLLVMCRGCRHEVIINVDKYPGDLPAARPFPRPFERSKSASPIAGKAPDHRPARPVNPTSFIARGQGAVRNAAMFSGCGPGEVSDDPPENLAAIRVRWRFDCPLERYALV
jgi:hypothetical protein